MTPPVSPPVKKRFLLLGTNGWQLERMAENHHGKLKEAFAHFCYQVIE
jgi:hypothetical protein